MKLNGFAERLALFTTSRRLQPYEWGVNDCMIFAADAALAVSGRDILSGFRGQWTDEATARALLEAQGGLIAAMDTVLPRKNLNFAQRGDLVLVKDAQGEPSLGVVVGAQAAAPGPDEMVLIPMGQARLCWEV